jgi:hypothetical protein
MKHVPHWQLLMLIYFILVAAPVMIVHSLLKKKVLANKTPLNLLLYFAGVVGTAFLMHFITMLLYFEFLFRK